MSQTDYVTYIDDFIALHEKYKAYENKSRQVSTNTSQRITDHPSFHRTVDRKPSLCTLLSYKPECVLEKKPNLNVIVVDEREICSAHFIPENDLEEIWTNTELFEKIRQNIDSKQSINTNQARHKLGTISEFNSDTTISDYSSTINTSIKQATNNELKIIVDKSVKEFENNLNNIMDKKARKCDNNATTLIKKTSLQNNHISNRNKESRTVIDLKISESKIKYCTNSQEHIRSLMKVPPISNKYVISETKIDLKCNKEPNNLIHSKSSEGNFHHYDFGLLSCSKSLLITPKEHEKRTKIMDLKTPLFQQVTPNDVDEPIEIIDTSINQSSTVDIAMEYKRLLDRLNTYTQSCSNLPEMKPKYTQGMTLQDMNVFIDHMWHDVIIPSQDYENNESCDNFPGLDELNYVYDEDRNAVKLEILQGIHCEAGQHDNYSYNPGNFDSLLDVRQSSLEVITEKPSQESIRSKTDSGTNIRNLNDLNYGDEDLQQSRKFVVSKTMINSWLSVVASNIAVETLINVAEARNLSEQEAFYDNYSSTNGAELKEIVSDENIITLSKVFSDQKDKNNEATGDTMIDPICTMQILDRFEDNRRGLYNYHDNRSIPNLEENYFDAETEFKSELPDMEQILEYDSQEEQQHDYIYFPNEFYQDDINYRNISYVTSSSLSTPQISRVLNETDDRQELMHNINLHNAISEHDDIQHYFINDALDEILLVKE